jgi:hypothetical protein
MKGSLLSARNTMRFLMVWLSALSREGVGLDSIGKNGYGMIRKQNQTAINTEHSATVRHGLGV